MKARIRQPDRKRRAVALRDGLLCHLCGRELTLDDVRGGKPAPNYATLDHVVPSSKGGDGTIANLKLACPSCNQARGSRDIAVAKAKAERQAARHKAREPLTYRLNWGGAS